MSLTNFMAQNPWLTIGILFMFVLIASEVFPVVVIKRDDK